MTEKELGGGLPEITRYNSEQRRDYLILVAAVAASDNELHPDELALLNRWMDQFDLPEESRTEVLAAANSEPMDLEGLERRLSQTDLVYSLILDMMGMAMADGVLMDDERILLREVADYLAMDPIDFNILIEFVHAAYQASFLANPEPLYEHNIDSAFQLLRDKGIPLFAHTLLCVSSAEFDSKLKARWYQYENLARSDGN